MSWEFTRDMIAPQDQQALDAFEDRRERCEAYYQFIKDHKKPVCSILEIGVRCGYCARAMMEAAITHATYIGIDKSRDWGGWRVHLLDGFEAIHILAESRHILSFFQPGVFDIVHVDGDHTQEGAWYDISMAMKLVLPGGTVIVDDAETGPVMEAIKESGILKLGLLQSIVSEVTATGQLSLAFTVKT